MATIAVALLITCSGCMKVSMEIGVAPDGSSTGRVVAGVDASLAQSGETVSGGPFGGLTNSGGNWKSRENREGNWLMTEAVGSAAPGQALFPESDGEAPKTTVTTSARRLSTRYTLSLIVPPPDKEMMSGPTEDMDAQTQALVKSMLSSFEIIFSLK
ncbi:MAG: hypothetical protein ACM3VW_11385, partial [Bacteroidota bacterium]